VKNGRKSPLNTLLRAAREELGWTQQKLADQIGTTPVNISRWENGLSFPSPHFRRRMCDFLGKTPAELGLLPPSSPHGSKIWNMPMTRNPFFTGREDLLALLLKRLSTARMAALTQALTQSQAQALYGLGGIGKTQTAAEYAFRYGDYYTHVFWMLVASRETLVADFVTLAQLLDLQEPAKDEHYQTRIIASVKRWLAANEGWLLIMDNADDLKLAQEFLPTRHKGYVLFTTRAQAAGQIAASIEVEKLNLQEGTLLLLRWSKRLNADAPVEQAQAEDRAAAERIVQEMDGLPLALVQVGAYVDETGCSLADYLGLYSTHRKELLARPGSLLLDYSETVATTWLLSFQQIEQQSPAAADVLRLCAFLAPDAIPEELFARGATKLSAISGAEVLDAFKLNEALAVLRRYSLVRRNGPTNMLSIHRLVQAVLKESMDEHTRSFWAERTVRVVNEAFPENAQGAGADHQYYLPHVQECAALIKEYHLHFAEAAQLLYRAGIFLYNHGFYPQSQSLHQQALAIREQVFGPDHPAVADSLNILAMLSRIQNDFEQAERFHQQALAIRQKTLGFDHLETAISLNNLGVLYRIQGKHEQAEPLLQQALNVRKQALGPDHPETLITFINLAKLYSEQRKYEQAEQLLKQALTTSERVLEPDNPLIAHNLNLLARLYFEQGNHEQAETSWKRSLAIIEKTNGSEHPITAERLNDLAELYFAQGRYTQAQSLCQRALSIYEKTFGPEHSGTIAYRELLTRILNKIEEKQDDGFHPAPATA
jgi:tetratricopeptide (TPR) repeat protein/DNA-binding XRE family transcriptional regulator